MKPETKKGVAILYMTDGSYNMLTKVIDDNSVPEVTDSNDAFTYDGMGRLLTAGKKQGASWISLTTLAYNAIGKRKQKRVRS